jgi:glycosyltransferase involved in cell wall biosynthesis
MLVTDNYNPKYTSEAYKEFLLQSIPDSEWANVDNERYVRQWTRDINNYMTQYDTVDVLLVPLAESKFNSCKSQLKLVEAAFKDTAVVCSDFGPYQIDTVGLIEKGGIINPNGNAILIDESKNHKAWAKAIEKLANNPELIETLKTNLRNTIIPKYNLKTLSDERLKIYKEVLGKA